jgi:hypothetical protein
MTTDKQKKANKKNSKQSTGPKTSTGKSKSSQNALKHGLFASSLVINTGDGAESMDEYQELHQALMDDRKPVGVLETLLVEKIACSYWKKRRVLKYESGVILGKSHDFKSSMIASHLDTSLNFLTPDKPAPKKLKHFNYTDHIEDDEFDSQIALLVSLRKDDCNLTSINKAVIYVCYHHIQAKVDLLTEDDLQQSIEFIKKLSSENKEVIRKKVYDEEVEIYLEMKEVREWETRFDHASRIRCLPDEDDLNKISKYEAGLENSIFKNLSVLMTLQKNRQKLSSGEVEANE